MTLEPLLTVDELEAIRDVGEAGMVTQVNILRSSTAAPDPANDYGDDDATAPADVDAGTTKAWFVSKLESQATDDAGNIVTVERHIVRVPVGTDLRIGDTVKRVDTGTEFSVIDTNVDDTWPEWFEATITSLGSLEES